MGRIRHNVPLHELREVMARWFFMSHLTSRYTGSFESRAECVMYLARLLRDRPGTLDEVGRWYATDPGWSRKVAGCVRMIAN